MPYRKTPLATDEVYHLINRGVAKQPIFSRIWDYKRASDLINYYRFEKPKICYSHFRRLRQVDKEVFWKNLKKICEPLVEIIAYCLMPNHFHLLIRQLKEKGISTFMGNFQNAYVRFFNRRYKRIGPLFQSVFKAVRMEDDEQLLHVTRYVHLNPSSSYLVGIKDLEKYQWSSLSDYLEVHDNSFVNPKLVLDQFKDRDSYRKYVFDQADYQRELQTIKNLLLEEEP